MKNFKTMSRRFSALLLSVVIVLSVAAAGPAGAVDAYALTDVTDTMKELVTTPTTNLQGTDTEGTINIQMQSAVGLASQGALFTAYRLLDTTNTNGYLSLTIPAKAQAFWNHYLSKTATMGDIAAGIKNNTITAESVVAAFAAFAADPANAGSLPDTANSGPADAGGKASITAPLGLYAILQTSAPANGYIASAPILASLPIKEKNNDNWLKTFTMSPKNDTISVDKAIVSGNDTVEEKDTGIGSSESYIVTAELPTYGSDLTSVTFSFVDTLAAGLTFKSLDSVEVSDGSGTWTTLNTASYTFDSSNATAAGGGTISLELVNYLTNFNGKYSNIRFKYTVQVNKDAVVEGTGNANQIALTYTTGENLGTVTVTDTTKLYTFALNVDKVNADDNTEYLAGAKFELYYDQALTQEVFFDAISDIVDNSGTNPITTKVYRADYSGTATTTVIEVSGDGRLRLEGLKEGTYYLKEIVAPIGYNLPTDAFAVTIAVDKTQGLTNKDDNYFDMLNYAPSSVVIGNDTGIVVPGTGGVGTVIFTAGGLMLLALAAYLLFFKKNAENTSK